MTRLKNVFKMPFADMNEVEFQYATIYWILYILSIISIVLLFYQLIVCFIIRTQINHEFKQIDKAPVTIILRSLRNKP